LSLPGQVYLRHREGESIGPMPLRALEVLFDSRVVDEGTPISEDGVMFKALRDFPLILGRMVEVKELLGHGQDPWSDAASPRGASGARAAPAPRSPLDAVEAARPLRAMLVAAVDKATGRLTLRSDEGDLEIRYKEGKIVAIESTIEAFQLESYLQAHGIANAASLAQARERAPMMGGDIGGALISLGLVQPHTYFERFIGWAKTTLGAAVVHPFIDASFAREDVPNPPVPLGFDRLGILMEIVRDATDKTFLDERTLEKRPCPLIPSQVEGVKIDDMKLKASELRVINAVNGAKSFGEIIDTLGGSEQKALEIMRVVHFASETGFIVFGEDPLHNKELQEAAKLRDTFERLRKKNNFEIIGVTEKATDDDVRSKYNELAKMYHPDKIRAGAAAELLEVRRELFGLITEAFNGIETEAQRYEYANDLAQGRMGSEEELNKVQSVLHAETLFKKAEILSKVKKYDEALHHIEEAIGLKPDDVEFKIFRAYYAYRHAQRIGGADADPQIAIKAILGLMKNDANIASGYMFLAQLYKDAGKQDVAVKYFEKVLEYDERNPDAMREVRLANMRADKSKKKGKWF
jgi:tetratricopeptide (TPR) repeat protein